MPDTDVLVSELTQASAIDTNDLMLMTQPDAESQTGYASRKGTVLQVATKVLKNTEYTTDLPDFTDKTIIGALKELKADTKPVKTANGNPCTFDTDLADNLVSLTAEIVAGGGNGSPDNPIPINGYTEANITVNGDTVTIAFGQTVYGGVLDVTSGKLTITHTKSTLPEITEFSTSGGHQYSVYRPTEIKNVGSLSNDVLSSVLPAKSALGDYFGCYHIASNIVICVPDNYTIADYNTEIAGSDMVFPLATPFDIDLMPVQISALVGTNNITSDLGGDVEVRYADGQLASDIIDLVRLVINENA